MPAVDNFGRISAPLAAARANEAGFNVRQIRKFE
jgi:hypothetical protein